MPRLLQEDLQCFECSLEDCKEKNKNCKRRIAIEEKREYQEYLQKQRMTTILKRHEPIVVR
ncbi:MAG: hypothetical protein HGA35_04385 [Erysipelotrichaceae bacterium]|nr:hypothetical protein [Erysipelotrichaceae bacterium]